MSDAGPSLCSQAKEYGEGKKSEEYILKVKRFKVLLVLHVYFLLFCPHMDLHYMSCFLGILEMFLTTCVLFLSFSFQFFLVTPCCVLSPWNRMFSPCFQMCNSKATQISFSLEAERIERRLVISLEMS